MTLNANAILDTTGTSAIDFRSTVDAASAGGASLTINGGGPVTFGAAVGSNFALSQLDVSGSGAIALDGNVTTSGTQTYGGAVTLGAPSITLATTASDITLDGQVTGGSDALTLSPGTGNEALSGVYHDLDPDIEWDGHADAQRRPIHDLHELHVSGSDGEWDADHR